MKKVLSLCVLLFACSALAELPIPQTSFRKAPQETLEKFVTEGNAEAQLELALRFYAGHQVKKDETKAFELMQLAAEQQHPEAMVLMSRMYAEGIGTSVDSEQEELWFAQALVALPGNKELLALYDRYINDASRAQRVMKKCADAGYGPAVLQLGFPVGMKFYQDGLYEDALSLFVTLADNGSAESAYYAGRIYAGGEGNLEADDVEAFVRFKQAAEDGYAPAQYELARGYEDGRGIEKDFDQALFWYQKAAENGYADAQFRLAEMAFRQAETAESVARFDERSDLKRNEYRKALSRAVKWYQSAAEQDHAGALYVMGRLSASGEGVAKNPEKAVQYYERAYELGYAEAGFYLGLMCHAGMGVSKNIARAAEYYEEAAEKGVLGAFYYLANGYRFGEGVPKHPIKGEGIYYGKLLKGTWNDVHGLSDGWILEAAREYGVIRWNRGGSSERQSMASKWVGLAAQNGDATAEEIFRNMKELKDDGSDEQVVFKETKAKPWVDAVKKMRHPVYFPFVQFDAEDFYSKTKNSILFVRDGLENQESVNSENIDGLHVKYARAATSHVVDYSGIILAGLEFTDRETGERYWSFAEYSDKEPLYQDESLCDLFISVDKNFNADAKLTGWAVVYGQLLPDGRTVAVFDQKESKTDGLSMLFNRNRYSPIVENKMNANVDLFALLEGQIQSAGEAEAGRVRDLLLGLIGVD